MSNRIQGRYVQKHDVEANWLKATNFTPLQGELIVYDIDENYDYERLKIGDGVTLVNDLPFCNDNSTLEEHTHESDGVLYTDTITGALYRLYIADGKLTMVLDGEIPESAYANGDEVTY